MKILILGAILALTAIAAPARADDAATCKAQAAEKKLAGAAQQSFLKKCAADAGKVCDTAIADKKLKGAAANSFRKKCVSDATGA